MSAFFDTNILIDMLAGYAPALAEAGQHSEIGISRVTWIEVLIGAPDSAVQQSWESFMDQFEIVEIDEDVSREGIALRKQHRIKLPDALIWASARAYGADLVTRNTRDFSSGMPGVRVPYTR